jgi:protein associated with RNAse G/E
MPAMTPVTVIKRNPEGMLSYVDLALDLWVAADGKQSILDEAEFNELDLDPETRRQALAALAELQAHFAGL